MAVVQQSASNGKLLTFCFYLNNKSGLFKVDTYLWGDERVTLLKKLEFCGPDNTGSYRADRLTYSLFSVQA